jgi:hypothetical protein
MALRGVFETSCVNAQPPKIEISESARRIQAGTGHGTVLEQERKIGKF